MGGMVALRPRWLILNKRGVVSALVIFVILALLAWGASLLFRGAAKVPPQEMLKTGLEKTLASGSFRYRAEARIISEGKDNAGFLSRVEGEKVSPDRVRIKGVMMNTPIEFIQVGDSAYLKDQSTGKWITLPGNKLADSELFYSELNPLAFFNFKDVPELKYVGEEKVNGKKLLLLEMRPNLMDPFLELRLKDYYYKVWLSPEDYRLRQASIRASDKQDPGNGIEINLQIWDYDKNIVIDPPAAS